MRGETLQLIAQQYKEQETTMNNYTPTNWTTWKYTTCIDTQKHTITKFE